MRVGKSAQVRPGFLWQIRERLPEGGLVGSEVVKHFFDTGLRYADALGISIGMNMS